MQDTKETLIQGFKSSYWVLISTVIRVKAFRILENWSGGEKYFKTSNFQFENLRKGMLVWYNKKRAGFV